MNRKIIVPIDAILSIIKDYTRADGSIPEDAVPLSLMVRPTEQGMFAIRAESPTWTDSAPVRVEFDIRRIHTV